MKKSILLPILTIVVMAALVLGLTLGTAGLAAKTPRQST